MPDAKYFIFVFRPMKELYLYGSIFNFSAELLIQQIEENMDKEIVLRVNTPGGGVLSGYGLLAKMREHGDVHIKVDGSAMSMGAFALPFAKSVEALDVSQIMIHRADMYVDNDEDQKFLDNVNKQLRAKMTRRIDEEQLKKVSGYTLDDIFDPSKRIDVHLSAADAKKIGLVDKVVKLDPEEMKAFQSKHHSLAAQALPVQEPKKKTISNSNTMTKEQLKKDHPAVYAAIHGEGVTAGKKEAKEVAEAWAAWGEIKTEKAQAMVAEGIQSGVAPTAAQLSILTLEATKSNALASLQAGSAAGTQTPGETETAETVGAEAGAEAGAGAAPEASEAEKLQAETMEKLGLNK